MVLALLATIAALGVYLIRRNKTALQPITVPQATTPPVKATKGPTHSYKTLKGHHHGPDRHEHCNVSVTKRG